MFRFRAYFGEGWKEAKPAQLVQTSQEKDEQGNLLQVMKDGDVEMTEKGRRWSVDIIIIS